MSAGREWLRAAWAERAHVPPGAPRARWLIGYAWLVVAWAARRLWWLAVAVPLAAGVGWLDLHVEAAGISLVAVLTAATGAGICARRWAPLAGLIVGLGVALTHLLLIWSGRPVPAGHPASVWSAAALVVLAVPCVLVSIVAERITRHM